MHQWAYFVSCRGTYTDLPPPIRVALSDEINRIFSQRQISQEERSPQATEVQHAHPYERRILTSIFQEPLQDLAHDNQDVSEQQETASDTLPQPSGSAASEACSGVQESVAQGQAASMTSGGSMGGSGGSAPQHSSAHPILIMSESDKKHQTKMLATANRRC